MSLALLTFALAALLTVATPGPTSLLAFSNGARHGLRDAGFGIAGAVLSDLVLIAAVSAGLGVLLSTSQLLFSAVKWLGVAYLAYIGLCCTNRLSVRVPLSPDGLIPWLQ